MDGLQWKSLLKWMKHPYLKCKVCMITCSNSDLTRVLGPQMVVKSNGDPIFQGISRLVKYHNLGRSMISSYLSPPSDAIVAARNIWLAWQSELKIHRQLRWKSWKVFPQHEFSPSKGSFLEGKWDPLFQENLAWWNIIIWPDCRSTGL